MPRRKRQSGRISVFKGQKAKLNHAIFQTLALKGPQTIYGIHKIVKAQRKLRHVRYASVNKRVRSLEESGYIRKIGLKRTKAGFEATIYELTSRAYLAILLNSINLNELITQANEDTATEILGNIVLACTRRLNSKE